MSMLAVACNHINNDPQPIENQPLIQYIEDDNELQVTTLENNLILTFNIEDFNEYRSEYNIKKTLSIKKLPFDCQKDEFFSNYIWIVKPDNIRFDREITLTVKYTHEEFAPDFITEDLRIYRLKREFLNQENSDDKKYHIRVSDMTLLDRCVQNNELMYVTTKISELGGFVLGRVVQ